MKKIYPPTYDEVRSVTLLADGNSFDWFLSDVKVRLPP